MRMQTGFLVTGGAGFIGSNFVLTWMSEGRGPIVNLDALTYAGNLGNLTSLEKRSDHEFVQGDIGDSALVRELLERHRPRAVVHFAAESHVDRSIVDPDRFVRTNVNGTFCLLEECRRYLETLTADDRERFRFLHVSTDEVYGSLAPDDPPASEQSPYRPNSPYAASKAAADHLVRAYHRTYGLPAIVTNCSNNYGPYQFPEKLIPLVISNALRGLPLPVYGDGLNVRDWLFVADHCKALAAVLERGRVGETYNIGGDAEKPNLEVVTSICRILDELHPSGAPHEQLITFVKDRPGHDRRYSLATAKIQQQCGWQPEESFETGLRKTVAWYLSNQAWTEAVMSGEYRQWVRRHYAGVL